MIKMKLKGVIQKKERYDIEGNLYYKVILHDQEDDTIYPISVKDVKDEQWDQLPQYQQVIVETTLTTGEGRGKYYVKLDTSFAEISVI